MPVSKFAAGLALLEGLGLLSGAQAQSPAERPLPEQAQIIDQKSLNVLEEVLPPAEANATTVRLPTQQLSLGNLQ